MHTFSEYKDPQIGDTVRVINWKETYARYKSFVEHFCPNEVDLFTKGEHPNDSDIGRVVFVNNTPNEELMLMDLAIYPEYKACIIKTDHGVFLMDSIGLELISHGYIVSLL